MKKILKAALQAVRVPIDFVLVLFSIPSALILLGYRKFGSWRLPMTTRVLKKIGLFPIRAHYYEPLFQNSAFSSPLSQDRSLPGIDWNQPKQLAFLGRLTFRSELVQMKWDESPVAPNGFYVHNPSFASGDADYFYQFLRATKPRRVIEIGSGYSTKVAMQALRRNAEESGIEAIHTCIEPYEMNWLESFVQIEVIRRKVEDCDLDWSKGLRDGDLLFVDSSHMVRPQGDVLKEYLDIFPRLASGVYIHVHDIFSPKDYPRQWVVDEVRFWNEQYLLEALLSNSDRYEVIGALNYLKHSHYDRMKEVCPYLTVEREPGSFYMRVR